MESIAERVKHAREAARITQPELAARVGVSQGTIGNIETGLRKRPRDLLAIAAALGVDPYWLETGKASPPRQSGSENLPVSQPQTDFPQSLGRVAAALQCADDLTLDQVRPLLARLIDTPQRAPEIVPRLSALLAPEHTTYA